MEMMKIIKQRIESMSNKYDDKSELLIANILVVSILAGLIVAIYTLLTMTS